jgi:GNAT superfamily N-acetyltransferase
MYDGMPTLLDQIRFVHGPRDLLARYAACANDMAADLGITLRLNTDFARLVALNALNRECWPALSPIFNPANADLTGKAFYIEGIDELGDTVLTSAGRLYDHGDRSIAQELRALRVFYDDPAPHAAAGARIEVTAPSAEYICGRVMFSGAVWVRPDYRRHGLTKIVPRLTRAVALAQWNTPVFWATIEHKLEKMGVARAYGSWHIEEGIVEHIPLWRGTLALLFMSMGQATLLRDLASSIAGYEMRTGASRRMDNARANVSFSREDQGMSTRS